MKSFRVRLSNYFGPVDVLVALVQSGEVEVLDLALSDVVLSYLTEFTRNPERDLEEAGEFVVFASILLELKSRVLLPLAEEVEAEASSEAEPSTRRELLHQIREYRRFQDAAEQLAGRAKKQRECMRRLADDLPAPAVDPGAQSIRELELWDLVAAFGRMLRQNVAAATERVAHDPTPLSVYRDRLEAAVHKADGLPMLELFGRDHTRTQLIGKFLALLELIRSRRVWVEWSEENSDLMVLPPSEAARTKKPATDSLPTAPQLRAVSEEPEAPPEVWPDLPEVPELPPRSSAWEGYQPLIHGEEGEAA